MCCTNLNYVVCRKNFFVLKLCCKSIKFWNRCSIIFRIEIVILFKKNLKWSDFNINLLFFFFRSNFFIEICPKIKEHEKKLLKNTNFRILRKNWLSFTFTCFKKSTFNWCVMNKFKETLNKTFLFDNFHTKYLRLKNEASKRRLNSISVMKLVTIDCNLCQLFTWNLQFSLCHRCHPPTLVLMLPLAPLTPTPHLVMPVKIWMTKEQRLFYFYGSLDGIKSGFTLQKVGWGDGAREQRSLAIRFYCSLTHIPSTASNYSGRHVSHAKSQQIQCGACIMENWFWKGFSWRVWWR